MSQVVNIANALTRIAGARPHAQAIVFPAGRTRDGRVTYAHLTYRQLDDDSSRIARGLVRAGIGRGVRAALMVKPSLEFFSLMFGLFKAGAVPVLIDPGIGVRPLRECLAEAAPEAFIGIPQAHVARAVLGWGKESIRTLVTVGRRLFWGGLELDELRRMGEGTDSAADTQADEMAAILFTSGSTGTPKGAVYTHGVFAAQVEMIRDCYGIQPGEVDLPTFPPFALFDPALGMTTIIPDMDATRPASVNPPRILEAIENFGVTNMFGSPALLNTLSRHTEPRGIRVETLRRVISAGAPVPPAVIERMLKMLPAGARIHTPYGATECLPVCSVDSAEILGYARERTERGEGVCVGKPVEPNLVRVIRITDEPIERWSGDLELPAGQTGEITVLGPTTTKEYFRRDAATRLAKILAPDGRVIHRMGDLGYFDAAGRLWYCGRKSHRVETAAGLMFTETCEAVFNTLPGVMRTALVGVGPRGNQKPVLCVEPERGHAYTEIDLRERILNRAREFPHTAAISTVLFHEGFPVDIRHNAKIGREKLAVWAAERLR
ncbi:MAG: Long-chain-fatty-acid--CoA ligase [Myxococcota bacterium]|nr:Long-chain-fatty-acid--CoA ligase [Myxococcota bacterium]